MRAAHLENLLAFARRLLRAATFADLVSIVREEVRESVGYDRAWFYVAEQEDALELRLIDASGDVANLIWDVAPVLKVRGDPFLEEFITSDRPVVVEDARTDPRTDKAIVEKLQNRTIIGIPLRLIDKPLGVFAVGTFGDEGPRPPDAAQLEYLVGMGTQIAVAASRIRFVEETARAEKVRVDLERRLLQAQRLESLGMLAGGVAHDFNNLLTVIATNAGLLTEELEDSPLLEEVGAIERAAKRAAELTHKLLAMSRAQPLSVQPLDMGRQLHDLLKMMRRILPETIEIDLIQAKGLPIVEGDAGQLDQVFMNLLINARDAMAGGGRLTIESEQVLFNSRDMQTHPWAKRGRYVQMTITDTGIGMPPDVIERIFEPFFTTKGTRAGTGFGLAVAYGIVRQHGGMLQCESEVGSGTSFKIYLPASEKRAEQMVTKSARRRPSHGTERVLVAEDDEHVRKAAVGILKRAGYLVRAVDNGEAACRLVAQEEFDLVLLDVIMPGPQCEEVVVRLRQLRPQIPIVLSSGYTAGASIAPIIRVIGQRLLRKPYDPDQLLGAVREALQAPAPLPAEGAPVRKDKRTDLS
jgi:signal transduction histidine kinase/ActR/RegA family two-component response regulator